MICVIGVIESSSLLSQSQGIQSKCLTSSKTTLPLPCKLHLFMNSTYDSYGQVYQPYNSSKNLQASHEFEIASGGCHVAHKFQLVWAPQSPCSISTSVLSCIYLFRLFIKYLFHSNVQTSFIFPLIPYPNASTPNLGNQ